MVDERKVWEYPYNCPLCSGEMEVVAKIPDGLLMCNDCTFLQLPATKMELTKPAMTPDEKDDEYLAIVQRASMCVRLEQGDKALDIYCRDGELLGWYTPKTFAVGTDPNVDLAKDVMKSKKADIVFPIDFNLEGFKIQAEGAGVQGKFKIITLIDVLQDVPDPKSYIEQCKELLHSDGVLVIQVPYLPKIMEDVKNGEGDFTRCRNYFLTYTLRALLVSQGFAVWGGEHTKANLRLYSVHKEFKSFCVSDYDEKLRLYLGVNAWIATHEVPRRLDQPQAYQELESLLNNMPKKRGA